MNLFDAAKKAPILDVARVFAGINPERNGSRWQALCPFHEDTNPSLFLDEEKNTWKCFGCDRGGSGVDLVIAAGRAVEPREAAEVIVRHFGIVTETQSAPGKQGKATGKKPAKPEKQQKEGCGDEDKPFLIQDYSELKKLPVDFLKGLGIWDEDGKVCIPYFKRSHEVEGDVAKSAPPTTASTGVTAKSAGTTAVGTTATVRYRKWSSFWWPLKSKPTLYGLDRLDHFLGNEQAKWGSYIILVEGESDTQTLWLHGYQALGVPGARNFKKEWAEYLYPFARVFLHREPDEAGQAFVKRTAVLFQKAGYKGELLVFSIEGHKDPNELHKAHPDSPDSFKTAFEAALATAAAPAEGDTAGSKEDEDRRLTVDEIIEAVKESPVDIFIQPVLGSLAALPTPELARVKAALRGKVNMTDLNQAVKEEKRRLRIHLRVAQSGEKPEAPTLPEILEGCPADMPVPDGWQIGEEGIFEFVTRQGETGVYQTLERRFPIPAVLSCIQRPMDPSDEGTSYEVSWLNGSGGWRKTSFPATTLFDKSKLTSTASVGLPVDSENARGLLRWLAALRDLKMLPSKQVVTRCGWHKDLFILGNQVVGERLPGNSGAGDVEIGDVSAPGDGDSGRDSRVDWTSSVRGNEKELVNGMHTRGDPETQKKLLINVAQRFPLAGFLIGAACAGPLVRFFQSNGRLEIHGFVVEVTSDQAGIGKTTGQELAASVFGNPGHLVRTFDRTSVAWEVLLYTLCDCPVFLEETQMSSKEDMAAKLIYSLALGMGRERGNRAGGLRATRQFFNTVLLASERSLKTFAAREGIEARVISLPPVFGGKSPERGEQLRKLRAFCYTHYGHAGQGYIRYLTDRLSSGESEGLLDVFENFCTALNAEIPPGADGEMKSAAMRMATRVAVCWAGLQLLLLSMGLDEGEAYKISYPAATAAWKHVLEGIDSAPLWKKALYVIQSYAAENTHRIAGMEVLGPDGKHRLPSVGYIGGTTEINGRQAIGFFPNAFDEAIKKYLGLGNEGESIRKGLVREGVVVPDKAGKSTRSQRIRPAGGDSFTARVVCIPRELVFPKEEDGKGDIFEGQEIPSPASWEEL